MRSFHYDQLVQTLLTPKIVNLLTSIHEYRGKQGLYLDAKADTLSSMLEIAKIQSTEASNRIEGIYTSDVRLQAIVRHESAPQTRNLRGFKGNSARYQGCLRSYIFKMIFRCVRKREKN